MHPHKDVHRVCKVFNNNRENDKDAKKIKCILARVNNRALILNNRTTQELKILYFYV